MQYEVTIGIPVYQSVDFIQATILSALNQTFPNIEYLIVDDCGYDGTIDLIVQLQKEHPRGDSIHILHNDKNRGSGYCRNRIIDEAQGNYLYFMDSDDLIEPNTIELLLNSIKSHQAQIAYGSYEIIDKVNGAPTEIYQKDNLVLLGTDQLALYAFKNNSVFHVSVCNFLVNLDFLRHSGIHFIDANFWEDMAFTTELVTKVDSAVLLSDITYHYLRHSNSLSHYQSRKWLSKIEIEKNIAVINYLKTKAKQSEIKSYTPYLCYNLEMNSFYVICQIIKHSHQIFPKFTHREMHAVIGHPLSLCKILSFRQKMIPNLLLWLLGTMPVPLFIPFIWLVGKLKKAI